MNNLVLCINDKLKENINQYFPGASKEDKAFRLLICRNSVGLKMICDVSYQKFQNRESENVTWSSLNMNSDRLSSLRIITIPGNVTTT